MCTHKQFGHLAALATATSKTIYSVPITASPVAELDEHNKVLNVSKSGKEKLSAPAAAAALKTATLLTVLYSRSCSNFSPRISNCNCPDFLFWTRYHGQNLCKYTCAWYFDDNLSCPLSFVFFVFRFRSPLSLLRPHRRVHQHRQTTKVSQPTRLLQSRLHTHQIQHGPLKPCR